MFYFLKQFPLLIFMVDSSGFTDDHMVDDSKASTEFVYGETTYESRGEFVNKVVVPQYMEMVKKDSMVVLAEKMPQLADAAVGFVPYPESEDSLAQVIRFMDDHGLDLPDNIRLPHLSMNGYLHNKPCDHEVHILSGILYALEFYFDDLVTHNANYKDAMKGKEAAFEEFKKEAFSFLVSFGKGEQIELPQNLQNNVFCSGVSVYLNRVSNYIDRKAETMPLMGYWRAEMAAALGRHLYEVISKQDPGIRTMSEYEESRIYKDSGMETANLMMMLERDCYFVSDEFSKDSEDVFEGSGDLFENIQHLRTLTNTIASYANDVTSFPKEIIATSDASYNAISVLMMEHSITVQEATNTLMNMINTALVDYEKLKINIQNQLETAQINGASKDLVDRLQQYISGLDTAIQATYDWQINGTDRYDSAFHFANELYWYNKDIDSSIVKLHSARYPEIEERIQYVSTRYDNAA